MANSIIAADTCMKIVDAASRSCQSVATTQSAPPRGAPDWDALANSFSSLSAAIGWGAFIVALISLLLGVILFIAGLAWAKIVTANAEREARDKAEAEVRKWLKDEAFPQILRDANEFLRTFREDHPISDADVEAMAAAAGEEGKEDENGEEK